MFPDEAKRPLTRQSVTGLYIVRVRFTSDNGPALGALAAVRAIAASGNLWLALPPVRWAA